MTNESHPFSDEIHIEQLEVSARIGVPEKERATPQRLSVGISFWPYQQTRDVAEQVNARGRFDAVIHNAAVGYREPRRIVAGG